MPEMNLGEVILCCHFVSSSYDFTVLISHLWFPSLSSQFSFVSLPGIEKNETTIIYVAV